MRYEAGKIILEMRPCYHCNGKREIQERVRCARYSMTQQGRACPHCGTRRKDGHTYLVTGKMIVCPSCNGTGQQLESDHLIAKEIMPLWWADTEVEVRREPNHRQSFNEAYIGFGLEYCCTDYGRAWDTVVDKDSLYPHVMDSMACNTKRNLLAIIHPMGVTIYAKS